jgi:hypothetical protein
MRSNHFLRHINVLIAMAFLQAAPAFAGDMSGKSGLDLDRGYDVNTVATITGKVSTTPYSGDREMTIVDMNNSSEKVHLAVGPASYWETHGIKLGLNDDIIAKGSKSQGKDGKLYLLVRKLENRTTGSQIELRTEKGEAVWNGAMIRPDTRERPSGGQMQRGGGMMRGGGGGMMRR